LRRWQGSKHYGKKNAAVCAAFFRGKITATPGEEGIPALPPLP
jgi:hypothetical protein